MQVELATMLDAVQDTETKMVEMSALNHLMSTHVLQQAQQIEFLYEQVNWTSSTSPSWFTISMFSCGNCNSWYSSFITFCLLHIHKKVLEHLFTTPSVPLNMTELYYSFCFWIKQAVEATNNVVLGNKELSQAIQRNSSSRTFLLLFLFVLTFSVLFLDWYSWVRFFFFIYISNGMAELETNDCPCYTKFYWVGHKFKYNTLYEFAQYPGFLRCVSIGVTKE